MNPIEFTHSLNQPLTLGISVLAALSKYLWNMSYELTFKDGVPDKNNFHQYRMIRQKEAPKSIEVHFVQSEVEPIGLGEPLFPPVFAGVANALYRATGKRFYDQPFAKEIEINPSRMDVTELALILSLTGLITHSFITYGSSVEGA